MPVDASKIDEFDFEQVPRVKGVLVDPGALTPYLMTFKRKYDFIFVFVFLIIDFGNKTKDSLNQH